MIPGNSLFAESTFGYAEPTATAISDDITFDDYGLQNEYIVITEANFEDAGTSEYNSYPIPRNDGTGFISRYWRKKQIRLVGYVKNGSREGMETKLDELKKSVSKTEKILRYKNGIGGRNIRANLVSAEFDRKHYHLTFCPFVLTFETLDAFWYDDANESVTFSGVTASRSESLSNSGSGNTSPVVHFVLNSATDVTTVSFSANGKTISVSGIFPSGTIATIDGIRKTVSVNGVESDYSGTFPELLPGENYATFSLDGTFDAEVVAIWKKLYL